MTLAVIAASVAINVASNVITSKIVGKKEPPAQIGSGTSPSLSPGEDIEYRPIEGSNLQEFGNESEKDSSDEILAQLTQAGISPADLNQHGIVGMAVGGYLNRAGGGPLYLNEGGATKGGIGGWFDNQDPQVQSAITSGIASIGEALFMKLLGGDDDERKGSLVRTETLPGNSNRRRSALEITPVGGSAVTFANQGSALQRPMFMPNGGAMHGPGGPKDDLIPVMASNGEYMLSKAAVDAAGNGSHAKGIANLEKFNKAGNRRYG